MHKGIFFQKGLRVEIRISYLTSGICMNLLSFSTFDHLK